MYMDRRLLKMNAKNTLSRGYWSCVLAGLVLALVTGGIGSAPSTKNYTFRNSGRSGADYFRGEIYSNDPGQVLGELFGSANIPLYMMEIFISVVIVAIVISILIAIFLLQPLEVGCRKFYIDARENNYDLSDMGAAFSASYSNIVKIMFLRQLYIFLWSLLFIIPGIIKSYEYRMVPYILAEDPGMSASDAFYRSKCLMTGSKFDAFVFDLSFIGWFLLDSITFGIAGIFYVRPYYFNACAELYAFVKAKPVREGMYEEGAYDYLNSSRNREYGYTDEYGTDVSEQPYPQPSEDDRGMSGQSEAGTVSADDARPFNTPYGQ